jgi:hypothetical protein
MSADAASIPGYCYGDPSLPSPSLSTHEFEQLKAALLFTEEDRAVLRAVGDILVPQADAILDVWYSFVGSHDFLLAYFSRPDGPSSEYLSRVRSRFGQWIADTCYREYDQVWLAYQEEIGRRHFQEKNHTDGQAAAGTPPLVHFRYINALVYPIYATVRPFLERAESDPAKVERMHQAWLKAVLLQVTLWARVYTREGTW